MSVSVPFHCLKLLLITWLYVAAGASAQMQSEIQQRREWRVDELVFSNNFSGARLSDLRRLAPHRYLAISRPEYSPINPSPWYAFDISASLPVEIEVQIMVDSTHPDTIPLFPSRPWLSHDRGQTWHQLSKDAWQKGDFTSTARIHCPAGTLRVAAFRPYTLESAMMWCDDMEKRAYITGRTIGLSAEGRAIRQFTISESDEPRFIVVLGGQHPPEANGDLGLLQFVDEICADTDLSSQFRKAFQTVVIPMINPDGKHHGNWRGTLGGMDPNRDWQGQTLPEIKAVTRYLRELAATEGHKIWFAIDFHATNRDFFYIGPEDHMENPASFARRWFASVEKEEGNFKVQTTVSHTQGTSRQWCAAVFKCPVYTREFSYAQDPKEVALKSRDEARALMRVLLSDLDQQ